jgi:hypothetical protein
MRDGYATVKLLRSWLLCCVFKHDGLLGFLKLDDVSDLFGTISHQADPGQGRDVGGEL